MLISELKSFIVELYKRIPKYKKEGYNKDSKMRGLIDKELLFL